MTSAPTLSAILPLHAATDETLETFQTYRQSLESTGYPFEVLLLVETMPADEMARLEALQEDDSRVRIIALGRNFGEATTLAIGTEYARGDIVVTLPDSLQVEPSALPRLIDSLEGVDMVIARREVPTGRRGRFHSRAFHAAAKLLLKSRFDDLECDVRVFDRKIMNELTIYGDQHLYFPILVERQGFKVRQVDVPAVSSHAGGRRLYPVGQYFQKPLDLLVMFFLIRFTKRPLRFFGGLGLPLLGLGVLIMLLLVAERLFFGMPLADRPAMIISSLMMVLGIQVMSVGLIGEILIFTHAKELKDYRVERVIERVDT